MYKQLSSIVFKTRQWYRRRIAPAQMQSYLATDEAKKLHIGAGPNLLDGWLNTTLQPLKKGSIHLNAIKPYPLPDASFDYVFSEHMIEHVTFQAAQVMLSQCFRVLKSGGRIRIATPDLERMLAVYTENPGPEQEAYIRWTVDSFLTDTDGYNPSFVINKIFHGWGHVFIYDQKTLTYALENVGFRDVVRFNAGISDDPHLQHVEQHGKVINNEPMNQYETLVLEARKP
jgi:SAM-dependent methyltransferase